MRLYSRQKLLLSILDAAGGVLSATDMQKLLFLYTQQCEAEPSYKFIPHRFGCYSFQAAADREALLFKGCLMPADDGAWQLSSKAKPYIPSRMRSAVWTFVTTSVTARGAALIRKVYRAYPYYATRSEILERMLPDAEDLKTIAAAKPKASGHALFTIGYEGDSIDGYLDRLIRHDVKMLCDVRMNPLSRKTGFSKNQLAGYCGKVGIRYRHVPELGIPGHRRRDLQTLSDYEELFEEYTREDIPLAQDSIDLLADLLKQHKRIALTCFEKEPERCHRHCVADELLRKYPYMPTPMHI